LALDTKILYEWDGAAWQGLAGSALFQSDWKETQPIAQDGAYTWRCSAMNADGNVMLAGRNGKRIYLSTNGGASWTETQPAGAFDRGWYCCAVSSTDGSVMVAGSVAATGRLWLSTNTGANWTEVQPAGASNLNWECVSVSANGSVILAGDYAGRLWLSTNTGANWAEVRPAGDFAMNWSCCSMSSSGAVMLAGVNGKRLWLSINTGANWTEMQPAGVTDIAWLGCSVDSDGSVLLAGGNGLWKSVDTGANWAETVPLAGQAWQICSISQTNGSVMLAGILNGRLYKSSDTGASWAEVRPVGNNDAMCYSCSMDADGSFILSGCLGLYLYGPMSPRGYVLTGGCANEAVTTDSQTEYWGSMPATVPSTTADNTRIYIPKAGVISAAQVNAQSGTAGSNENWSMYIRVNNTTDYLIQTLAANTAQRLWSNYALSIQVYAGDYIEIKEVQPAWGTNPANVRRNCTVFVS
jgi:photosystem II stability/assembly factor-like uncharacterized protein